jgi:hypothetical protein
MSSKKSDRQKEYEEILRNSMKTNCSYSRLFLTDIEFAKEEFAKAGVNLDPAIHNEMVDGYRLLRKGLTQVAERNNQRMHTVIPII